MQLCELEQCRVNELAQGLTRQHTIGTRVLLVDSREPQRHSATMPQRHSATAPQRHSATAQQRNSATAPQRHYDVDTAVIIQAPCVE